MRESDGQESKGVSFAAARIVHRKLADGGTLAFYGNRGTGKTRMASELAKINDFPDRFFGNGFPRSTICLTATDLFSSIRGTYRRDAERSEEAIMDVLAEVSLLVIEEIQERGESSFDDQKLTAVIDSRFQPRRPSVIIANLTKVDFEKSISPSFVSRIQESGGGIHFNWPSYRSYPGNQPP